jgi:hypothetical protein
MCSRHDMYEYMLNLALSKNQSFPCIQLVLVFCSCLVQPLTKSSNSWRPSVFGGSRTSSDKNLQIVKGGQYLVDAVLMPKFMSQEEQMGLLSCNFFFRIVAIGLIFKATEQTW